MKGDVLSWAFEENMISDNQRNKELKMSIPKQYVIISLHLFLKIAVMPEEKKGLLMMS